MSPEIMSLSDMPARLPELPAAAEEAQPPADLQPDERRDLVLECVRKVSELLDCTVFAGASPYEALLALDGLVDRLEREGWRSKPRARVLAAIERRTR